MVGDGVISSRAVVVRQLVTKYDAHIRKFINRRSGPAVLKRTTVEDLHQATVATALECADRFEFHDDARFLGWILVIARRKIARSACPSRREPMTVRIKRAESSGVGVPEMALLAETRTPSSIVAGQEHKSVLSSALLTLPEHYRLVLTLYELEGRPLAEVAEAIGRSRGATAQLLRRALQALRARMVG